MSVDLLERPEEIVLRWRTDFDAGLDTSPAGPLFTNGRYAEAELLPRRLETGHPGTSCTASGGHACC